MPNPAIEPGRWSLQALLPATSGPELDRVLADLEEAVAGLEARRADLSPDLAEADFIQIVATVDKIAALSQRLGAYAYLWFSEDTQNQEALAFRGRMDKLLTDIQNRTLFFSLWWKGLDEGPAARLVEWIGRGWVRLACLAIGVGLAAVALVRMTGVAHVPGAW